MCSSCQLPEIDPARSNAFAEQMIGVLNHAGIALMTSIGHRTGLFDAMSTMPPATSEEVATKARLHERYVREWLGCMVTAGIVEYDPQLDHYSLPPEHAAFLTRAASPNNVAVTAQFIGMLGSVEDDVVDCFRNGGGVPYDRYTRFPAVMREDSNQTTVGGLDEHILPLVPGLVEELQAGIEVLDVGCGAAAAIIHLAQRFPRSRFTGYDLLDANLDLGRVELQRLGLANVTLARRDVSRLADRERFDLITAFDAIHDQARPDRVLAAIHQALRPTGTFLMQDITGSSYVHKNRDNPVAPLVYTISTMHCMTVSLSQGGMGLGAAWGKEKATQMLREAGFTHIEVQRLEHDILNNYYIARKS